MDITSFNELFTDYENLHTRAEIEEEVEQTQEMAYPDPIKNIDPLYRMPIHDIPVIAKHHYIRGYIDALKWVLREEK